MSEQNEKRIDETGQMTKPPRLHRHRPTGRGVSVRLRARTRRTRSEPPPRSTPRRDRLGSAERPAPLRRMDSSAAPTEVPPSAAP